MILIIKVIQMPSINIITIIMIITNIIMVIPTEGKNTERKKAEININMMETHIKINIRIIKMIQMITIIKIQIS